MSTTAKPAGCTYSLLHTRQINCGSASKLMLDSIYFKFQFENPEELHVHKPKLDVGT